MHPSRSSSQAVPSSSCKGCCLKLCSGARGKLLIGAGRQGGGGRRGLGIPFLAFLVLNQDLTFSGLIGSGLCVFSRHPIQEIIQHVYTLNGYPYMVRVSPPHPPPLPTQVGCSPPGTSAEGSGSALRFCLWPAGLSWRLVLWEGCGAAGAPSKWTGAQRLRDPRE